MVGISKYSSKASTSLTEVVHSGLKNGKICSTIFVASSEYLAIIVRVKSILYGAGANCEMRMTTEVAGKRDSIINARQMAAAAQ